MMTRIKWGALILEIPESFKVLVEIGRVFEE
jgi:hypothetical protein